MCLQLRRAHPLASWHAAPEAHGLTDVARVKRQLAIRHMSVVLKTERRDNSQLPNFYSVSLYEGTMRSLKRTIAGLDNSSGDLMVNCSPDNILSGFAKLGLQLDAEEKWKITRQGKGS